MTSLTSLVLNAILYLMPAPAPHWEESPEAFRERMTVVAQAIEAGVATTRTPYRRQMALALVVVFWGESRFAPDVHNGSKLGDRGRAICLGQAHQGNDLDPDAWRGLAGVDLEATTRCATVSANRLKRAWRHCRSMDPQGSWPEAMVLYGTGNTCDARRVAGNFTERRLKWNTLLAKVRATPAVVATP